MAEASGTNRRAISRNTNQRIEKQTRQISSPQNREAQDQRQPSSRCLYADPLPKWVFWPLGDKLPMIQGPQKIELCTTELGERKVQSYPELDFDLWDPNGYYTPRKYEALHDPHLHKLFESKNFREHLQKEGLINKDGKVICNLQEFNKYRYYLHRVYRQLEEKEQDEGGIIGKSGRRSSCSCRERPSMISHSERRRRFHDLRHKVAKRKQLEKMAREIGVSIRNHNECAEDQRKESSATSEKLRQIKEKVKYKQRIDNARIQKRIADDHAKRMKLRKEKEQLLAERERLQKEQFTLRMNCVKDRQYEERQKKLERIKEHLAFCNFRVEALAAEKQMRLKQRQEKLKRHWETRKYYQMNKIYQSQIRKAQAERERSIRVEQRRRNVQQLQHQHQEMIRKSADSARQRHQQQEKELQCRLKERQAAVVSKMKKSKYDGDQQKLTFDLTQSFIDFMEMMGVDEEVPSPSYSKKVDYSSRIRGVDPRTIQIYSKPALPNWSGRGENFDWWNMSRHRRPRYRLVKKKFDSKLAKKSPESIEEAAAKCVQMVTFLSAKVIYPALLRVEKDKEESAKREKKREEKRKEKELLQQMEKERKEREIQRRRRAIQKEEERLQRKEREKQIKEQERQERARKHREAKLARFKKKQEEDALKKEEEMKQKEKKPIVKRLRRKDLPQKSSSVRFNLAKTVEIPLESREHPEADIARVDDSTDKEDESDTELQGTDFPTVEANDSLTLLRRSKTQLIREPKPTRFARLIARETLGTLHHVLVSPSPYTPMPTGKSAANDNILPIDFDLHVTPLTKLLAEQVIVNVGNDLGIFVPLEKHFSDLYQSSVPLKKSMNMIKSLKDMDLTTPAFLLVLAVLEFAAKQTNTPFDRSLYPQQQNQDNLNKNSCNKNSCNRKDNLLHKRPGSSNKLKEIVTIKQCGEAEDQRYGADIDTELAAIETVKQYNTPHTRTLDKQANFGGHDKNTNYNAVDSSEENKDGHSKAEKKTSTLLERISSFFLSKTNSRKSVKSKVSQSDGQSRLTVQSPEKLLISKSDECKIDSDKCPSDGFSSRMSSPQLTVVSRSETSTGGKAEIPSLSSEMINAMVHEQINRILYDLDNPDFDSTDKKGVRINHMDRAIISDTSVIERIISEQLDRILEACKTEDLNDIGDFSMNRASMSDRQVIECIVNEQIYEVLRSQDPDLWEDHLNYSVQNIFGIDVTDIGAFAAIVNAYATEMNLSVQEIGASSGDGTVQWKASDGGMDFRKTRHPDHLELLNEIMHKMEKQRGLRGRKRMFKDWWKLLKVDPHHTLSQEFLEIVKETYRVDGRDHYTRLAVFENVLKQNLINAITALRENKMHHNDEQDFVVAIVASYMIAHSLLPLAEDTSYEHILYSEYKEMEAKNSLRTPLLIDMLIVEVLENVRRHLRVGTFNGAQAAMAVHGLHRNAKRILKEENIQPEPQSSDEGEEITVPDKDFAPMLGDRPLGLDQDEASSALIALSAKNPDQLNSGTEAAERNSFFNLVKPDVSRLKTFANSEEPVTDEAAKRHLSSVSMQFQRRSQANFGPVQAAIKYDKLKKGSMPVMSTRIQADRESDESDEDADVKKDKRTQLKAHSIAVFSGIKGFEEEAEVPPEDPELLRLSTRREKKARERQMHIAEEAKSEGQLESPGSSQMSCNLPIGAGLRPRPSSAYKSQNQIGVQTSDNFVSGLGRRPSSAYKSQNQIGVQTSDNLVQYSPREETGIQVTGNEAAVQTGSSIRILGRHGSTEGAGSSTLSILPTETWQYTSYESLKPEQVDKWTEEGSFAALHRSPDQVTLMSSVDIRSSLSPTQMQGIVHSEEKLKQDATSARPVIRSAGTEEGSFAALHRSPDQVTLMSSVDIRSSLSPTQMQGIIHSEEKLKQDVTSARPVSRSAGTVRQESDHKQAKSSSDTVVEEIVEYEEIIEVVPQPLPRPVQPAVNKGRRGSFVPNFVAPAGITGTYGQQNRRMSYFIGYDQQRSSEDQTRSVLERAMDPELPHTLMNRDDFVMDEDDEEQTVNLLVSSSSSPSKKSSYLLSGKSDSGQSIQKSNKSNNNVSLPPVGNSNNNSSRYCRGKPSSVHPTLPDIVSPYASKADNLYIRRIHMGSIRPTGKDKLRKDPKR